LLASVAEAEVIAGEDLAELDLVKFEHSEQAVADRIGQSRWKGLSWP
jgi:hypothetical protein